jgi:hypothetical protein
MIHQPWRFPLPSVMLSVSEADAATPAKHITKTTNSLLYIQLIKSGNNKKKSK